MRNYLFHLAISDRFSSNCPFRPQFSFAISSTSYEIHEYCWMSVQHGMIINFMIPTSLLIVATTVFGTLTLRTVVSKQRQVIVESIENILEKCQHIDATMANANILAAESNLHVDFVPSMKCCEEMEKVHLFRMRMAHFNHPLTFVLYSAPGVRKRPQIGGLLRFEIRLGRAVDC